ncbi:MAG: hypothetical protein R2860_04320 [Desulfobacterales bacterium]
MQPVADSKKVNAAAIDSNRMHRLRNLCGCRKSGALTLAKKTKSHRPKIWIQLYEEIMKNKKGTVGRAILPDENNRDLIFYGPI